MSVDWYTTYNEETGDIHGTMFVSEDEVAANTPAGCSVLTGQFEYSEGYIVDGAYVPYTPEQAAVKATRPKHNCYWSNANMGWADQRTLLEAQIAKNTEINQGRMVANRSYFTYSGKQIACDELSRSDIDATNGYIALNNEMPPDWPGAWKAMDNSYVAVPNVATWKLLYAAMIAQGTANFARAQALKTALAAASTVEQVDAIAWV